MRKNNIGWFVEVPKGLKEEFKRLYPGRAAQRKLTVAAIEWAVRAHPSLTRGTETENRQLRTEYVSNLSGKTLPPNARGVDVSPEIGSAWIRLLLARGPGDMVQDR